MRSSPSPAPEHPSESGPGLGWRADRGSAPVEFLLVGMLVVVMGLALVQVVLMLHVRNTLTSSAYEGARHAAQADRTLADGEQRALAMAADALGGIATQARSRTDTAEGAPVVVVELTAPVPVLGLFGVGSVTVDARAFDEAP
ncbi:TadE/TadG family type IV pilus assembly protein [Demequina sp.]|uniref:TadE/TadG family type IV pilus assembly protein n=1 Tax=Demequina sp. TaxID=2050685 RepID=UPI003A888A72